MGFIENSAGAPRSLPSEGSLQNRQAIAGTKGLSGRKNLFKMNLEK
ncbi:hypothetical protein [Thermovenabulum sp.]